MHLSPQHQRILLEAARDAIRRKLRGQPVADEPAARPGDPSPDAILSQLAGCFVTLHSGRTHELRGCVGRLDACDPLLKAVRRSAVSVLSDPRFGERPVGLGELPELVLEISVLSPLRPAPGPLAFDLLNEGVYLLWGDTRSGCFLPQVARETGWSKEQLLCRLCVEKLGLPPTAWQDARSKLLVFTTLVIGPEPFVPEIVATSLP
jgi:AmmeMemoRadiSam system protein A